MRTLLRRCVVIDIATYTAVAHRRAEPDTGSRVKALHSDCLMATPEQFVDQLGVTAVNTAQLEETLLQKVRRSTPLDVHNRRCLPLCPFHSDAPCCAFRRKPRLGQALRRKRVCVASFSCRLLSGDGRFVSSCWFLVSENEQVQKLKKRLRAIGREIQAVEDGLNSVEVEAEGEPTEAQADADGLRNTGKQGDLQRATMLARLSALHTKQSQLQVRHFKAGLSSMLSASCTCNIWSSLQHD